MNQKKVKCKIALFVTFVLLLVIFSSELFIINHIHHNCSGKDCPICAEIVMSEEIIQNIGSAIKFAVSLLVIIYVFIEGISIINRVILSNSPVKMKVRMND